MDPYQQICRNDNWQLEANVSKNQIKTKLIVEISLNTKQVYHSTINSLDSVGQLSECFQGFDEVAQYMKDPSHLEINKSTGTISIIQKSPIRKNKIIKLAEIVPSHKEILEEWSPQLLKNIREKLKGSKSQLTSGEIKEILQVLVMGLEAVSQGRGKGAGKIGVGERIEMVKAEDKSILQQHDQKLKKLHQMIQNHEQKLKKSQKITAQNLQKLGQLKDTKIDSTQLNEKIKQLQQNLNKMLETFREDFQKKFDGFQRKKEEFKGKEWKKEEWEKERQVVLVMKKEEEEEDDEDEEVLKYSLGLGQWSEVCKKQIIDVSARGIQKLPKQFFNLTSLKSLKLCNNNITTLPQTLPNLTSLTELDISSNRLQSLPQSFPLLKNLSTLWCASNKLQHLPQSFCNLSQLKLLYLYNNRLERLPENFGNLKMLKTLWIYGNRLEMLPGGFGKLAALEELEINQNRFRELPACVCALKYLQKLYIQFNRIESIPDEIGNMKSLKSLWIYNNNLQTLPQTFPTLKSLQKLQIHQNRLLSLPKSFSNLQQLEHLQLSIFPESTISIKLLPIDQMKNLKKLTISYCQGGVEDGVGEFVDAVRVGRDIQVEILNK